MRDWFNEAQDMREMGMSWTEITCAIKEKYFPCDEFHQVKERIRDKFRATQEYKDTHENQPYRSVSYKENGDMVFEGIIKLLVGEPITPEKVMEAHNLDPKEWAVVSFKSNAWQAQTKDSGKTALWQSKITVRPRVVPFTTEDIDEWFASKDWETKKPMPKFEYNGSDEILEINYADLHVGLLSWKTETGANFDLKIVEKRFKESISDVLYRCSGRKFKLIRFITIGDIIHIDNSKNETTKGTPQQADGRPAKIFDKAMDMIMSALDALLEIGCPIEYVYIAGNHDRDTGYYLAHSLKMAYRNEPNIMFDIAPNPMKAKMFGNALVGYCHGDMPSKNMGVWLLKEHRAEYGKSKYAEIHSGHYHNKNEREENGIRIISLPSLCESSYWEHQQGYSSERALICYVWSESKGKRETWITNF